MSKNSNDRNRLYRHGLCEHASPGTFLFIRPTLCMFPWMGNNLGIRNEANRSAMSAVRSKGESSAFRASIQRKQLAPFIV